MLGLILEGGASRTVYSCGVMDVLMKEKIIADCIVGVSAGISFGVSYASGQYGRNLRLATEFMPSKKYMGIAHLLNPKNRSLYNLDYAFYEVPERLLPFDYEAFAAYPGKVFAGVTNLDTGEAEFLPVDRSDHHTMMLRASCALPLLFPVITINGKRYMDGGISDAIPFKKALDEGCDKNIIILTRERGYIKHTDKSTELAARRFRKYKQFSEKLLTRADRYNAQTAELEAAESRREVFVFRPESTRGIERTESNPDTLRMLYDMGYADATARMNELREYLEK